MSHNTIKINNIPPGSDGNISVDADGIGQGAASGYTPYVDTHMGTVDLDALADTGSAVDGQYLGYTAGTTTWEGKTLSLDIGQGTYDWRYPTSSGYYVSALTTNVNKLLWMPPKSGYGLAKTETPSAALGPFKAFDYTGGSSAVANFPTAWKLKYSGWHLISGQFRGRFNGLSAFSAQLWNQTTSTPLGPRVYYDPNEAADQGPCTLIGLGNVSANNLVGVRCQSGSCKIPDDPQAGFFQLNIVRL